MASVTVTPLNQNATITIQPECLSTAIKISPTRKNITVYELSRSVIIGATKLITVQIKAGRGTVNPGTTYVTSGSNLTVYFYPSSGYFVDYLLVDGIHVRAASSYAFTNITANHTLGVYFTNRTHSGYFPMRRV